MKMKAFVSRLVTNKDKAEGDFYPNDTFITKGNLKGSHYSKDDCRGKYFQINIGKYHLRYRFRISPDGLISRQLHFVKDKQ